MNWGLFCQIEVIILTIGLVVMFVLSAHQSIKDNSFFKRISVLAKSISDAIESYSKKEK